MVDLAYALDRRWTAFCARLAKSAVILRQALLRTATAIAGGETLSRISTALQAEPLRAALEARLRASLSQEKAPPLVDLHTAIERALRHSHMPAHPARPSHKALPAPRKTAAALDCVSILVVALDGSNGELVRQTLTIHGLLANVEVHTLDAACEALRLNRFDIMIVCDRNGTSNTLALMRMAQAAKAGGNDRLSVIFVATDTCTAGYAALKEAGVSAMLRVPFDTTALYQTLIAVTDRANRQDITTPVYCGPDRRTIDCQSNFYRNRRRGAICMSS